MKGEGWRQILSGISWHPPYVCETGQTTQLCIVRICCIMKNNQPTTHKHKRVGAVVLLESTAELAKILVPLSGDEFWVRLTDLTQLAGSVIEESKPGKKRSVKSRPNASPNSQYRV